MATIDVQVKEIFLRLKEETSHFNYRASCVITFIGPPYNSTAVIELLTGKLTNPKLIKKVFDICQEYGAKRVHWERISGKEITKEF